MPLYSLKRAHGFLCASCEAQATSTLRPEGPIIIFEWDERVMDSDPFYLICYQHTLAETAFCALLCLSPNEWIDFLSNIFSRGSRIGVPLLVQTIKSKLRELLGFHLWFASIDLLFIRITIRRRDEVICVNIVSSMHGKLDWKCRLKLIKRFAFSSETLFIGWLTLNLIALRRSAWWRHWNAFFTSLFLN